MAVDGVTRVDRKDIREIQDRLLPMGCLVLGRRAKADGLVAVSEKHVKKDHQSVHKVFPQYGYLEGGVEGRVLLFHLLDIERRDERLVAANLVRIHDVHQRLRQCRPPDAVHVEAIHVAPPVNLIVPVLCVLNRHRPQRAFVRKYQTSRFQPLVPRVDDRVQHALVQQKVAHPLGDDDVHAPLGQLHLLNLSLDDRHPVRVPVVPHDLLGRIGNRRHVNPVHVLGSRLGREQAQDARPAPDVKHNLVLENMPVMQNRIHVCPRAHLVLEHLLMDAVVAVRVGIVVGGSQIVASLIGCRHAESPYWR
mmetsp:Transcript_10114/g.27556  ORF Transcript_10114/g.27556 Transcript_10114/m.27556 type:complete len:306 (-) Transcript_10114:107-1024(-)